MANIDDKITAIRQAVYGKDVRSSIADGIDAINTEVESTTARQTQLETDMAVAKAEAIQATAEADAARDAANAAAGAANTATSQANTARDEANAAALSANEAAADAVTAKNNADNTVNNVNNNTLIIYKPWVATYANIAATYPTPSLGWTTQAQDTGVRYRYNGTQWVNIGVFPDNAMGDLGQLPESNLVDAILSDRSQLAEKASDITDLQNNKADKTEVNTLASEKADTVYVDNKVATVASGAPKGTYATLTDLQTAKPTGDTENYVVAADGHIYNWNGSAWADTGIQYQSTGIADNSITINKMKYPYAVLLEKGKITVNLQTKKVSISGLYLFGDLGLVHLDGQADIDISAITNALVCYYDKTNNIICCKSYNDGSIPNNIYILFLQFDNSIAGVNIMAINLIDSDGYPAYQHFLAEPTVTFQDKITIDYIQNKIIFPNLYVEMYGQSFKYIQPSDFSMSEMSLNIDTGGNLYTVYFDAIKAYNDQFPFAVTGAAIYYGGDINKVVIATISKKVNCLFPFNEIIESSSEPMPYLLNIGDGLRKWRTALSKAKVDTIVNLNVMGDSISEGGISDADPRNYIDKGYVGIIRNKLATKYGDVGKGMIPIYYPNGNPYWVTSGSWSIAAAVSGCTSRLLKTSSNGASVTINFNGTGIDVILVKGAILGQFNYTVDGGASTLFDCYQSGANYGAKLSITGLSSGDHTLVITKNNDGKEIWMIGHCEIKGTKGARVNLVGRWGTVVADSTPDGCLISEVDIWTPALTIIAFTANDYGNQTALATYQANLQTLIDRAKLYGDVLLTTIGLHSDTVGSIPQQSYFDTVKSLAIKNNCAYVDISGRWGGNTNVGTTGLLSDTVHPNAYGHQDIASAILKIIDEY